MACGLTLNPVERWKVAGLGCHCCPLAQSYVDRAATGVGMVAELAAERKFIKYSNLPTNLIFQPIAVETFGAFSSSFSHFISALGYKISSVSGKERETSFLFQRLSVALECFNTVLLCDTFMSQDSLDQ